MVDLILATARSRAGSRWRIFVGAQEFAARRRENEIKTILHARESGDAKLRGAANVVTLHDFLESLGHLEVSASALWMRKRYIK